jgi:hypothetical protein
MQLHSFRLHLHLQSCSYFFNRPGCENDVENFSDARYNKRSLGFGMLGRDEDSTRAYTLESSYPNSIADYQLQDGFPDAYWKAFLFALFPIGLTPFAVTWG